MENTVLDRHREEILALAARRGATNVRVFGSAARGTSRPDSDVDLLVSFDAGRSLLDLIGFKHDVEDLIHRPVDVVTDRALSPYIRDRVLAEAVPL
jgi:predicted nucleotidyltransferase